MYKSTYTINIDDIYYIHVNTTLFSAGIMLPRVCFDTRVPYSGPVSVTNIVSCTILSVHM
jgi:hypothetical protein